MDEDNDSTNWVLVEETDWAEDALSSNQLSTTTDSDHESEGSISIISDHPTDSYSEEEHEQSSQNSEYKPIDGTLVIANDQVSVKQENSEVQIQEIESSESSGDTRVEDVLESVNQDSTASQQSNDADVSSTSGSSSNRQWTYVGGTSKLVLNIPKKSFYLDCNEEPILEMSTNDTNTENEDDTENSINNQECQTVARKHEMAIPNIITREPVREVSINRIGFGILLSVIVLVGSHLIHLYSKYQDDTIQSPAETYLEGLADNEKIRTLIDFCSDRQKSKGEYSEHAVEKCVIRRLRRKNREEAMKKTEIYLQMKERILELREKELVEKENEMLRKWRKRNFISENEHNGKTYGYSAADKIDSSHDNFESRKESSKTFKKKTGLEGKKIRDNHDGSVRKKEKKDKYFSREKNSLNSDKFNKNNEKKYEKHSADNVYKTKKVKRFEKFKKEALKLIKEKVKRFFVKRNVKPNIKYDKRHPREDPNEDWYVKYNPVKNTVEIINITTLPEHDSLSIKNGNKTINGQWYFSLYGTSRTNIRNREKAAEWYFKRAHFREHKRDKAKWYFDYMSGRDITRYF